MSKYAREFLKHVNAEFLINTKSVKDWDDVKSDLNGPFRKPRESKWKTVETEVGECA